MKLVEMQINDFIAVLGSDTPAPGGGSASALAAARNCFDKDGDRTHDWQKKICRVRRRN